jgi:2-oxoisovalerate dehydrogenase E1 component
MFGLGAELGQAMNEHCFDYLDAPVARLHSEPTPHPFAPSLERAMIVTADRIAQAARDVVSGVARPIARAAARRVGRAAGDAAPPPAAAPPKPGVIAPRARVAVADGVPIKMPFGDLTVSEGKLVRWLKAVDQHVAARETIAEIETDKALVEIEAPAAGRLVQRIHESGDMVKMGETIGVIRER